MLFKKAGKRLMIAVFTGIAILCLGLYLYQSLAEPKNLQASPEFIAECTNQLKTKKTGVIRQLQRQSGLESCQDIYAYFQRSRKMTLRNIRRLEAINYFDQIEFLHLDLFSPIDLRQLDSIRQLKQLTLAASFQKVRVQGLRSFLGQNSGLKKLSFANLEIAENSQDAAVAQLSALSELQIVDSKMPSMTMFKKLDQLRKLTVRFTKLSDVHHIQSFGNIVQMDLIGVQLKEINWIDQLTMLRRLDLSYNPFVDVRPLNQLKHLESLRMDHYEKGRLVQSKPSFICPAKADIENQSLRPFCQSSKT